MSTDWFRGVAMIDHHAHGLNLSDLDRERFEDLMTDGHNPPPKGCSAFQSPLGLAIRRYCPPVLDLEPWADAEVYLERRAELGAERTSRRFLEKANLRCVLVDSGHPPSMVVSIDEMRRISPVPVHEVIRIEYVAEELIQKGVSAGGYADTLASELGERAKACIAFKSIVAYRCTFMIDTSAPTRKEVECAAGEWLREIEKSGKIRLTHPVLVRYGLWVAAELCRQEGLPLHIHVGLGDADIHMAACDPTHFTNFFRCLETWDVPIILLHNYPFLREAGWLAGVFQNIYFDLSVVTHFSGASTERVMATALEYAPFYKLMYASDAIFLAEVYYLASVMFRRALKANLKDWISRDLLTLPDAQDIVGLVTEKNAERVYSRLQPNVQRMPI